MSLQRIDSNFGDKIQLANLNLSKKPSASIEIYSDNNQPYKEITKEELNKFEEQIKKLNKSIVSSGKEIRFKYHDEAKELYVEVVDTATHEVVNTLPPEFLIDLSIKMKKMIGMFLDEKI